ncbi:hypothetical protein SAMN05421855_102625 [Ulvibacter litoralis]|uniref:Uncharacterized protein n=1 Tax=Ulvibacter litoralis TaxID=227084 RepID=A0A1G7FKY2_9FLAO|nr:hypothetical protein GCM10008083_12840 [Ulvibacter litoralis]SDE76601.1 hypothetical protein SAMN05421855_102625 [Ulvibacter litoralis]
MKLPKLLGHTDSISSIIVGFDEYILHYSHLIIEYSKSYDFLKFVSFNNHTKGHSLAIIGLPFYIQK